MDSLLPFQGRVCWDRSTQGSPLTRSTLGWNPVSLQETACVLTREVVMAWPLGLGEEPLYPSGHCRQYSYSAIIVAVAAL